MRRATGASRRVAIADSSPLLTEALAAVLADEGFQVSVHQPEEILDALRGSDADVLLIDGDSLDAEAVVRSARTVLPDSDVVTLSAGRGRVAGTVTVSRNTEVAALAAVLRGERPVATAEPTTATGVMAAGPLDRLTIREREVLGHMLAGASGAETAAELMISPHTVRTHMQNILAKLEAGSRHEAAAIAMRHGMRPRRSALPVGST